MTNPTSNFGWQMPTASDLVTDLPADFETFGQAVDTTLADLKGGTSGQILAKASNTDMDFTWVTNDVGDITAVTAGTGITGGGTSGDVTITNSMATAIDAKGDLIAGTGADAFGRLAVGANDLLLTAASGETTGLKYTGGWTTYTPTHLSLTIGNGTVVARYQKIGKTVNVFWRLTWGSTTSTNAYPLISLPITGVYDNYQTGNGTLQDTGTLKYFCSAFLYSTTYFYPVLWNSSGNWVYEGELNATQPATWTTGDIWTMQFSYEVA